MTDISAGAAVLARTDKFISFERAVHIVKGSQVIDAQTALGDLSDDDAHLTGLELQGGSSIETPNAEPGGLKLMSGDVINLTYYENTDFLQSATISRRSRAADCSREGRNGERSPRRQHRNRDGAGRRDAHVAECAGSRRIRSVVGQGTACQESDVERARGKRRAGKGSDRRVVYRGRRVSRDGRRSAGEADGDVAHARYVAQGRPGSDTGSHLHRLGADARRSDAGGGFDDALQHGDRPGGTHRRGRRAGAACRQRTDSGRRDQHRHERRRLQDEGVRGIEARAVDHVSREAGRQGRPADSRAHEAGSACQRRQPRARVCRWRERIDRADGHRHARAGREKRDADQRRQGGHRRQNAAIFSRKAR